MNSPTVANSPTNSSTIANSPTKPDHKPNRLLQLDGLRGVAIFLVILTHSRLDPFFRAGSPAVNVILTILANNGGIGVEILFLLSGYLMATLYPQVPSALNFLQKRYTRIFPAFLAMSLVLAIARAFWHVLPSWGIIALVLGVAGAGGWVWQKLRRHPQRQQLGQNIFKVFLIGQGLAVLGYLFLQWKVPSAVFLQVWPLWAKQITIWLVNATMSLPFGTYISQLDGVYWSVCTEVLFYLLYPGLFLPLFQLVESKKSWVLNLLAVLAMGPFLFGLNLVSKSILGLAMLQLHLAIFFLWGMLVSRLERAEFGQKIAGWLQNLPAPGSLVISLLAAATVVASPFVWRVVPVPPGLNTMVWSLPLAFMFFVTVTLRTQWSKFLQSKVLVALGTVSYVLYLTHTLAIEMFTRNGAPQTVLAAASTLFISLVVLGLFAVVMHYFLERPYFVDRIPKPPKAKPPVAAKKNQAQTTQSHNRWFVPSVIVVGYVLLVWMAYRVPVSPLAQVRSHTQPQLSELTVFSTQPTTLTFTGDEANLGMILVYLKPISGDQAAKLGIARGGETLAAMRVKLIDAAGHRISQTDYPLFEIYESRFFAIGVPMQVDSKGQTYSLEFSITSPLASSTVGLLTQGNSLRTVYFAPKKTYLSNPVKLGQLGLEKIAQPFTERTAQYALSLGLPLILVAGYLSLPSKTRA